MTMDHSLRALALASLFALTTAACKREPDRWEAAKEQAKVVQAAKEDAPPVIVTETNALNKAFPTDAASGAKRVFRTDKPGFADAVYNNADGKEICVLTISDTNSDPAVKTKFASATDKVGGFPVKALGNSTAMLVRDRFQVKVSSTSLSPAERQTWLSKVDISAIPAN